MFLCKVSTTVAMGIVIYFILKRGLGDNVFNTLVIPKTSRMGGILLPIQKASPSMGHYQGHKTQAKRTKIILYNIFCEKRPQQITINRPRGLPAQFYDNVPFTYFASMLVFKAS